MSSIVIGVAHFGASRVRRERQPRLPVALGDVGRDVGRLLAVVPAVRDEVLEDDLLQVPVLGVHRGERLERRDAVVLGLADPHEDPARERDPQLTGGADRRQAQRRVLRRRALVRDEVVRIDSSISPCDAVTSRSRARSSRPSAPRFECGRIPRSSARSLAHTT